MEKDYPTLSKAELIQENEHLRQQNGRLKERVKDLQAGFDYLEFELAQLKKLIFSSRSERFVPSNPPDQLSLDIAGEELDPPEDSDGVELVVKTRQRKKRKGGVGQAKRSALPPHLRRCVKIIEPDEDTTGMVRIGELITEELEYIPPQFFVNQLIRPKYADPAHADRGVLIAELPPRVIDKGIAGPGLLSQVLIDKYIDHLPCYRQEKRFARHGLSISRSTLVDWIRQCSELMKPLYQSLIRELLKSEYLQVDESPIPVLDQDKKGSTHKGYMWVYQAVNDRIVVFDYRPSKQRDGPEQMLKNYRGYLQTDGYAGYEQFKRANRRIRVLHCWAHARRYFYKALDNDPERAEYALQQIGRLYELERTIKNEYPDMPYQTRLDLRKQHAVPVLDELEKWLKEQLPLALPKSAIGQAVRYTLKRWKQLILYTTDGQLQIDNNPVENSIRPLALGRKNYLFAGSHEGAKRAAMMYSFFACCKLNSIEPFDWLRSTLDQLPTHPVNLVHELLPVPYM